MAAAPGERHHAILRARRDTRDVELRAERLTIGFLLRKPGRRRDQRRHAKTRRSRAGSARRPHAGVNGALASGAMMKANTICTATDAAMTLAQ